MVNGFLKFREKFQGYENQYVIIGGTACDLIMENEELPFRATKDIDIVLIVESSKNIKKHKNDVFRLAQLITANTKQALNPEIAEDMKKFLSEMIDEEVDLKSLGIKGTDSKKIIEMLYQCYGLKDY